MSTIGAVNPPRWELAAENIAVKIRWIGVLIGYLSVNFGPVVEHRAVLNAILALGVAFTVMDTAFSMRGRVFLHRYPLLISLMEALFIALLCHFHTGMDSPFRYYYFLSLICCAIRHSSTTTLVTCVLHCSSYLLLTASLPVEKRDWPSLMLMLLVLGWVTWAASALGRLLKQISDHLGELNVQLRTHQSELEERIAERTRELQAAQAHLLHQEKMAAFGLLAAGIAHEVGNPLTSISAIVQMLERRDLDEYTRDRLTLVAGQLQRIRGTLRELMEFSRPTSTDRARVSILEIVDEALSIAKYYKGTKSRVIDVSVAADFPELYAVHDQLVQVFLNLILNAVDATPKNGLIEIFARLTDGRVVVTIRDNGCGIDADQRSQVFQPYFTTKRHGTGLGLFVTRQLVERHGGEVTFDSDAGVGTSFSVSLPLNSLAA